MSLLGLGCWDGAALGRVISWVWGTLAIPAYSFCSKSEAPGNAGKPKILHWAPIYPGWREHKQWCLWFLCPRKFWKVLQGSLSLPASSDWSSSPVGCQKFSCSALLFPRRNCCLYTCTFDFAHRMGEFLILLCCGHLGPQYSQLFKSVFSMNFFILMLRSWERSSGLKGWPAALPVCQHYFSQHSCMIKEKNNSQHTLFSYQYITRLYLSWVFKVPLEM